MKPIIILEPNIANKIAAGEVVERPASIVKELLENSIDAGATSITVEIQNGGIDHIRITDNGCGIPESDVKLAFMRHATSKLTSIDELSSLSSFGFRGEALASIAAVSKVTLRTRIENAEYGTKLCVEGGKFSDKEICACPEGTAIEVDELFYNVPARLKFVKNARSEGAMIADYVSRIMLANPHISIKLINGGRTLLHTTGDGSLANAVLCVYGGSLFASMYEVDHDDGYISIKGYVGGESTARANRIQQSVFVNHRYIKSQVISNAVQRAYLTRVMNHRFPFFVLNMLISSREVDVNVHPNKLSVRFSDEERVARTVTEAVNEALRSQPVSISAADITTQPYHDPNTEIKPFGFDAQAWNAAKQRERKNSASKLESEVRELFSANTADESEDASSGFESSALPPLYIGSANTGIESSSARDFTLRDSGVSAYPDFSASMPKSSEFNATSALLEDVIKPQEREVADEEEGSERGLHDAEADSTFGGIPVYKVLSEQSKPRDIAQNTEQIQLDADSCTLIGAAFDTYIIVQQGDTLYYIDQHAAHERILYEKLISGELRFDSQFVSPPLPVDFDPVAFDCLLQNEERFSEFGYSIEFGDKLNVSLHAVPSIVGASPEKFLRDAVDMLLEEPDATETDLMRSRLIQMSCKRAVKAGNDLEIRQLKAIVDAYATGEVPLTCPHGRPVIIRVTKTELQKMFKRIV
ncbi:MAG: DNA mismatch repair endonuclease MutL [Clostridia bacterium]|nr:DNA mismatch repair endonuclease MutL [Clostridia bacterium]